MKFGNPECSLLLLSEIANSPQLHISVFSCYTSIKKNSIKHTGLSVSLSKFDLIHSFLWASVAKLQQWSQNSPKKIFFQGYNKPFTSENNIQSTFHYEITSRRLFPNQTTGTSTCVSLVLTSAKENPPPPQPSPSLFFSGDKSITWDILSSSAIYSKCRLFFLHLL